MKKIFVILGSVVLLAACHKPAEESHTDTVTPEVSTEELIKRGKYLATIGACNDCHSPKVMTPHGPVPDTSRLLSGHPKDEKLPPNGKNPGWVSFSMGLTGFVGPWGVSYSANLTPDDTGIGSWSLEQFKTAIRKGKYKGMEGSRSLLPPMPWDMYKAMTDDDLKAVFTYLKSLKPVNNLVPPPVAPEDI